jgi:hypothetical protein
LVATLTVFQHIASFLSCRACQLHLQRQSTWDNCASGAILSSYRQIISQDGSSRILADATINSQRQSQDKSKHCSPAAMADESHDPTPKPDVQEKEDAETRATRRELKQSSISDSTPAAATEDMGSQPHSPADEPASSNDAQADDLKEKVASPKKKRAHDQLDRDPEADDNDANSVASTDSGKGRATRLEPEKKRHRDQELQQEEEAKVCPCQALPLR